MILDLNDPSVLQSLKATVEEIVAPWVMDQARGREARTQVLGRVVYAV
jgi:hypothetical protein